MWTHNDSSPQPSTPIHQSSLFGTSANLINSIVGAGIIGIPYAIHQSGILAGIALLILVGLLTDTSLRMIVNMACFHPKLATRNISSYEDLVNIFFGRIGSSYVLINMWVLAYGAMVAYLLIVKDTVATLFGMDKTLFERNLVMVVTSVCVMVPLSMMRDMASLAITSTVSVSADVLLVVFLAMYSPMVRSVDEAGGLGMIVLEHGIHMSLFIGLGIISAAMVCQHSAFLVSGSLKDKTRRRWRVVTGWSIGIATCMCGVLGVCGYLGFLGESQGDILNNFASNSTAANAARVLLAITMFFTYPMESFVARHVMIQLFHNGDMDGKDDISYNGTESGGVCFMNRRQTWTVGIYISTLIPALLFSDIGPVLSLSGSVGGSCLAYIIPGCVYLGLNGQEFLDFANGLLGIKTEGTTETPSLDLPVAGEKHEKMTGEPEVDIPVAGETHETMTDADGNLVTTENNDNHRCKPVWWYMAGFPLWCAIASIGKSTMREKLGVEADVELEEDTLPTPKDFYMAIFFIVFGVLATNAGLFSNIYMMFNNKE